MEMPCTTAVLTTFAFEFAGCGAADVQSAKLYRQRRDYITADKMLNKAITEDPTNDEAWYLYAENLNDLKEYEKIATIIDTAMLYSTTHPPGICRCLRHNTWIELYNGGLGAYNAQSPGSCRRHSNPRSPISKARKSWNPISRRRYEDCSATSLLFFRRYPAKGLAN